MQWIDYVKVVRFIIGWLTAMLPIFPTQSFSCLAAIETEEIKKDLKKKEK